MEEILKKHVVLSMSNGSVLEGFVDNMEEIYLTLIENDNKKVIVKILDISFARIGVEYKNEYTNNEYDEKENYEPPKPQYVSSSNEYTMPMPVNKSPYVRQIEFVKSKK